MAAGRSEEEMLRQVVAAADLIAADEVGVVGFEVEGRHDAAGEDLRAGARGKQYCSSETWEKTLKSAIRKGVSPA